jgi:hypothetical protein
MSQLVGATFPRDESSPPLDSSGATVVSGGLGQQPTTTMAGMVQVRAATEPGLTQPEPSLDDIWPAELGMDIPTADAETAHSVGRPTAPGSSPNTPRAIGMRAGASALSLNCSQASANPSCPAYQMVGPVSDSDYPWRLLGYEVDSADWTVFTEPGSLASFRASSNAGYAPPFARYRERGWQGYDFSLVIAPGLRIMVAPATHLDMGLRVLAGPRWLCCHSPNQWEAQVEKLIQNWGVSIRRMRLSRVDLYADVLSRDGFPRLDVDRDFVSRARIRSSYGLVAAGRVQTGHFTSYAIGQGSIRLRVYDKTAQARAEGDLDFWKSRWSLDCHPDQAVIRLEWQLRRRFLEQFGVARVADLVQVEGDIMSYLLDWARLAGPPCGKLHQRPDSPLWAWLRTEIARLPLATRGVLRTPPQRQPNVAVLLQQAAGLVVSLAAALGVHRGRDAPVSLEEALEHLGKALEQPHWQERLAERWQRARLTAMAG